MERTIYQAPQRKPGNTGPRPQYTFPHRIQPYACDLIWQCKLCHPLGLSEFVEHDCADIDHWRDVGGQWMDENDDTRPNDGVVPALTRPPLDSAWTAMVFTTLRKYLKK